MRRAAFVLPLAALVTASCRDAGPFQPPDSAWDGGGALRRIALVACAPQSTDSTVQVVGPAGATLTAGRHTLCVPAGALAEPVTLRMIAPTDTVNRVVLSPHGLALAAPAHLSLSYANCAPVRWLLPRRVVYTTAQLEILEWLPSFDNPLAQRVTAPLMHFSTYAVAW